MSDYSFSLTTFSPSGKLVQIEYALNAVNAGKTTVAIKATDGVVVCSERNLHSKLIDEKTIRKVENICGHVGVSYAGMPPDFRLLLSKARKSAMKYYATYRDDIPVLQLVREIAAVMQEYTQSGGVRPFGVSLLVVGVDSVRGPQVYQVDPSGAYYSWKATAIGKNFLNAKNFLDKRIQVDDDNQVKLNLNDAIHTAILTLKENFEGNLDAGNCEVGVCGEDGIFRQLTIAEIEDFLLEVNI